MKKLLSLLSISTLATSMPAPLLANTTRERTKRTTNPTRCGDSCELKFPKILNSNFTNYDANDWRGLLNLTSIKNELPLDLSDNGHPVNCYEPIDGFKDIRIFYERNGKSDGNKYTIDKIVNVKITFSKNVDFGFIKYYITSFSAEMPPFPSLDWVKQQSQFNLVDSSKTMTWTRPDLIAVDDELNIAIANPNIDKVIFDNVQQSQTNKQWAINVKPETSEKDHNLQVFFTLDRKQYRSEITVSMQAKIASPTPSIKENLDKVIKFADDNNLGNIGDNNNETIISAITQKNSLQVDFSQIAIDKKDNHSVTLTAKNESKSYQGSVVVKYNVTPATVVDLKIDLQPTAPTTQVDTDYVGQIDPSTITNPVHTFSYADSESKIIMLKPTASSVITGVAYGCDEQWNKTSQHNQIDSTNGIVLDGSQLATSEGKYIVELSDNLGHINNIYLQIASKQAITNYFDTDNGKQFEQWAKVNGHNDIRGYSARQLNKLFVESKNWQQLASDSQFANALSEWFKTNGELATKEPLTKEQVIAQLQTQMPKNITIDEFDTSNYDFKKVSFELNENKIKPNEPVNMAVKYGSEKSDSFTLQIANNSPPITNDKSRLTGWAFIGVIIGVLSGLLLLGWLLKKFVVTPFICEPIRKKKIATFQRQTEKDIAQMKADEKAEQEKNQ